MQLVVPSAVSAAVSAAIDDLAVGLCHLLAILAHLAGDHLLFYFLNLNCSHSFSFFFLKVNIKDWFSRPGFRLWRLLSLPWRSLSETASRCQRNGFSLQATSLLAPSDNLSLSLTMQSYEKKRCKPNNLCKSFWIFSIRHIHLLRTRRSHAVTQSHLLFSISSKKISY